jgi:hypothetical protein
MKRRNVPPVLGFAVVEMTGQRVVITAMTTMMTNLPAVLNVPLIQENQKVLIKEEGQHQILDVPQLVITRIMVQKIGDLFLEMKIVGEVQKQKKQALAVGAVTNLSGQKIRQRVFLLNQEDAVPMTRFLRENLMMMKLFLQTMYHTTR